MRARKPLQAMGAKQDQTAATTAKIQEAGNALEQQVKDNATAADTKHAETMQMLKAILARSAPKRSREGSLEGSPEATDDEAAPKKGGANIQVEVDVNYKLAYESNYWRGILDAQGKTDGGYY